MLNEYRSWRISTLRSTARQEFIAVHLELLYLKFLYTILRILETGFLSCFHTADEYTVDVS
jgi:hypothetical protein